MSILSNWPWEKFRESINLSIYKFTNQSIYQSTNLLICQSIIYLSIKEDLKEDDTYLKFGHLCGKTDIPTDRHCCLQGSCTSKKKSVSPKKQYSTVQYSTVSPFPYTFSLFLGES